MGTISSLLEFMGGISNLITLSLSYKACKKLPFDISSSIFFVLIEVIF